MFITFVDPLTLKEVKENQVRNNPNKYNIVFFDYIRAMRLNTSFHFLSQEIRKQYSIKPNQYKWSDHVKIFHSSRIHTGKLGELLALNTQLTTTISLKK